MVRHHEEQAQCLSISRMLCTIKRLHVLLRSADIRTRTWCRLSCSHEKISICHRLKSDACKREYTDKKLQAPHKAHQHYNTKRKTTKNISDRKATICFKDKTLHEKEKPDVQYLTCKERQRDEHGVQKYLIGQNITFICAHTYW